ncbi:anthranilate synthase family protein [Kitasatospora purpeofusca]|uniref:anthranilate synthase family protein n=1 Tax=Kitasatospora purpeofusca TaxID=67352 RepID=UPI0036AA29E8
MSGTKRSPVDDAEGALAPILAAGRPSRPFALLYRQRRPDERRLEILSGEIRRPGTLAGLSLLQESPGGARQVLAVVPYRQVSERGLQCVDDGAPLLALLVEEYASVPLEAALELLPEEPVHLRSGAFDIDDSAYAEVVQKVIADEIGQGLGSNFVIKRSFKAKIDDYRMSTAVTIFRRLCQRETGAYWTFLIHTGTRTLVGATPECHVTLDRGHVQMNPISGTYRHPAAGPTLAGLTSFLNDGKESDELHMVLDEELKMMASICDGGGQVVGPSLREMTRLTHTQHYITGQSALDPWRVLTQTLCAPTVMGSPLESAARVIRRYEPQGRGYYSGVAALVGRDAEGRDTMDSAILIRTADLDPAGNLELAVGSTLVRHSDPASEAAETHAKAAGLMNALREDAPAPGQLRSAPPLASYPVVEQILAQRRAGLAPFWCSDQHRRDHHVPDLAGLRVLVIDAEDLFTEMISQQLTSLGLAVTVEHYAQAPSWQGYHFCVMGPGPGDPRDTDDPKIACLHTMTRTLLRSGTPFLAVCLSHQVLSHVLGLDLRRRAVPNQGEQRRIDLFGRSELVGFYNTFFAHSDLDNLEAPGVGPIEVCRDPSTGEVHALRGPRCASLQFHAESVLTRNGPGIFAARLSALLRPPNPHHP